MGSWQWFGDGRRWLLFARFEFLLPLPCWNDGCVKSVTLFMSNEVLEEIELALA